LGRLKTPQDICTEARADNPNPAQASDRFLDDPFDSVVFDIPRRLSAPHFFNTQGHFEQMERADWQQVDPRLRYWAAMVQETARMRGIPLYVHSAFRTEAQQAELIRRGVSKAAYPRSAHNIGEAVDIVHGVFHWNLTDKEWLFLHKLGTECARKLNAKLPKARKLVLNWGGDDQTSSDTFRWDPAHWEISDYRDRIRRVTVEEPKRHTPRFILRNYGV